MFARWDLSKKVCQRHGGAQQALYVMSGLVLQALAMSSAVT